MYDSPRTRISPLETSYGLMKMYWAGDARQIPTKTKKGFASYQQPLSSVQPGLTLLGHCLTHIPHHVAFSLDVGFAPRQKIKKSSYSIVTEL